MGIFSGIGSWIEQNTQQAPNAEPKKTENVKPNTTSDRSQLKLWREAEKKEKWNDRPTKVKVVTLTSNDREPGLTHMHAEFTLGLPPKKAYDLLIKPPNQKSSGSAKGRELLKYISKQESKEPNDPAMVVDKEVSWTFLTIPIQVEYTEKPKDLTVTYEKSRDKVMYMDIFEGSYEVDPIYIDSERLCNIKTPKSREEYEKCSGGEGRIASKMRMDHFYKASYPYNMPPFSWLIRRITVKTTKDMIKHLQSRSAVIRGDQTK